ncbi:hypothetical protein LZ11_02394 [Thermosediminibacter litoriperuensis]|uniref:Uncharacterized protein n=1 Tax=Thermosediminibacter litoriperuensis TaxID=291989 RepID=A0A5S5AEC6_9FIRM|nr:hypothetical protein LZ11_02394 [Thermosediminibacter litoriperuensis]
MTETGFFNGIRAKDNTVLNIKQKAIRIILFFDFGNLFWFYSKIC